MAILHANRETYFNSLLAKWEQRAANSGTGRALGILGCCDDLRETIELWNNEIAMLREQFMRYCALIEDHPDGWEEECWCRECLSYSGDDDARDEK